MLNLSGIIFSDLNISLSGTIKDDIDYHKLAAELGESMPTGSGVKVTQVEANLGKFGMGQFIFKPKETLNNGSPNPDFTNKSIIDVRNLSTATSSHATEVGRLLYGNQSGIAPAITQIDLYESIDWRNNGFLKPSLNEPLAETNHIQNHSWINPTSIELLDKETVERFDFAIDRDKFLAVVGLDNGSSSDVPNILAGSYNALSVGLTNGNHSSGFTLITEKGRLKPEIVVPASATSYAVPVVSGAASLLYETALEKSELSESPGNATQPETLRAILLAGATKEEFPDWRNTETQPFDTKFGAGELNIFNSYQVLVSGEEVPFNPSQPKNNSSTGWDFSTISNNEKQKYFLDIPLGKRLEKLSIVLTWNRKITKSGAGVAWGVTTSQVSNLKMSLFKSENFSSTDRLKVSDSSKDNYEHTYLPNNLSPGQYLIEVSHADGSTELTNYAIAWHSNEIELIETYNDWANLKYNSSSNIDTLALADPDGNGISNLMEYALNMNNLETFLFPVQGEFIDPADNKKYLTLKYRRRKDAVDIEYIISWSADLVNWNSNPVNFDMINMDSVDTATEELTVRLKKSLDEDFNLFQRLEIKKTR